MAEADIRGTDTENMPMSIAATSDLRSLLAEVASGVRVRSEAEAASTSS